MTNHDVPAAEVQTDSGGLGPLGAVRAAAAHRRLGSVP